MLRGLGHCQEVRMKKIRKNPDIGRVEHALHLNHLFQVVFSSASKCISRLFTQSNISALISPISTLFKCCLGEIGLLFPNYARLLSGGTTSPIGGTAPLNCSHQSAERTSHLFTLDKAARRPNWSPHSWKKIENLTLPTYSFQIHFIHRLHF